MWRYPSLGNAATCRLPRRRNLPINSRVIPPPIVIINQHAFLTIPAECCFRERPLTITERKDVLEYRSQEGDECAHSKRKYNTVESLTGGVLVFR